MEHNWDGFGSSAPSAVFVSRARRLLALFQAEPVTQGLRWRAPHLSVNERGHIILEWWQDERSLTVFIRSSEEMDYLKSWGSNIESEMEDGGLHRSADLSILLAWLDGNQ